MKWTALLLVLLCAEAAATCKTAADCSINGECTSSGCKCSSSWQGPSCSELLFADPGNTLVGETDVSLEGGYLIPGWALSVVVSGAKTAKGEKYVHLSASHFSTGGYGPNWVGNYYPQWVAIPNATEPRVVTSGSTVVVFFEYEAEDAKCPVLGVATVSKSDVAMREKWVYKKDGVSVVQGATTGCPVSPTVLAGDDGKWVMFFTAAGKLGKAEATSATGPYTVVAEGLLDGVNTPYVWKGTDGALRLLYTSTASGEGVLAWSVNGGSSWVVGAEAPFTRDPDVAVEPFVSRTHPVYVGGQYLMTSVVSASHPNRSVVHVQPLAAGWWDSWSPAEGKVSPPAWTACTVCNSTSLQSASCCPSTPGLDGTTSWMTKCNSKGLNEKTWTDKSCWSHGAPTKKDVVVFPSDTSVEVSTYVVNSTVRVWRMRGAVVEEGAKLKVVDGSLQVEEEMVVLGEVVLAGDGSVRGTVNEASLDVDPEQRKVGLRDCAFLPAGFTPRICGKGKVKVGAGGRVTVTGGYTSLFATVEVEAGGVLHASSSYLWGQITNRGNVTVSNVLWHTGSTNEAGGYMELDGSIFFDEWASYEESVPENQTIPGITNYGHLKMNTGLHSTRYMYKNTAGLYSTSVVNMPSGVVVQSGGRSPWSAFVVEWDFVNYGKFYNDKSSVRIFRFSNFGTVVAIGGVLNFGSYQSMGGEVVLAAGGEVRLQEVSSLELVRKLASPGATRSTPTVCRDDECIEPACPYPSDEPTRNPHCCAEEGPAGSCKVQGVKAYPSVDFCYPCEAHATEAGTLDTAVMHRAFALPTADLAKLDAIHARVRSSVPAKANFHFVRSVVRSADGTGLFVTAAPMYLDGRNALTAVKTKVISVVDFNRDIVRGSGEMVVGAGATLSLGIDSKLASGGHIVIHRGGKLEVDGHCSVETANHVIQVRTGGKVRIDGQLKLGENAGWLMCGRTEGSGKVLVSNSTVLVSNCGH